jgi:hypothetical protein
MGMMVWAGKGWVVPAATFGFSLLGELVTEGLTGDDQYYQTHGLALALALWASAAVNGIVFWHSYSMVIQKLGPSSRKPRSSRKRSPGWIDHSFMFVNQGVWVLVLVVCGLGALITNGI